AIGTAIVADPKLGGQGYFDYKVFPAVAVTPEAYSIADQLLVQLQAVAITLLWSGGVSAVLFLALRATMGLRPSAEVEAEGLDVHEHGERAYNY
ncbi:MAG: ammonia channel protein, partial [Sphingomonas hengshuiensis]